MSIETNWHIITGGPCSGKTKVVEYLAFLGYFTIPETARALVDIEKSKGKTTEEIRGNEIEFQRKILQMKIEVEERTPPEQITFLDRGIPDSIAYYRLCGENPAPAIEASRKRRYKKVFLLEQLPFEKDSVRVENEALAKNIHRLIYQAYSDLEYEVVRVPPKTIEERVRFILVEARIQK